METKRLTRDMNAGVLAGVIAGFAKYFDKDPVLFRVIAMAILIFTGIFPGALLYFVAWLIVPEDRGDAVEYTILS